jgi:hypothetical protein
MKTSKIFQFLLIITISIIAVSCGSTLKVTNDYDKTANFSNYKSFSIYRLKTSGSVSQLNAERIVNSIKAEMIAKGYNYVESKGDLTINAITILKDKQAVSASTNYYGYGGLYRPYGYYAGMGMASTTSVSTYNYKDGSLTIEMVDTKSTKMVWQGIGNKEIDGPSKDPDTAIRNGVNKIMATFPSAKK